MSQGEGSAARAEFILRRIHKDRCSETEPTRVFPTGFSPNKADTDGLSVFLEVEGTTPDAVADGAKNPHDWYVVRIPVQVVLDLGLTLAPDDDPAGPPGHMVIPELSRSAYEANKAALLAGPLDQLTRIASENIVRRPVQ
jgi:hypothetical protein